MDAGMMGQMTSWIEQQFSDKQTLSKDEIVQKSQSSNLPQEAKSGIQQLPDGQYTKDSLMAAVKDMMMSKAGGGMGGMMGGGGGGMGGY